MADIKFEIVESIKVLSTSEKGWTKELNKVAWNGHEPKYDIRDWAPNHERPGKGITLTEDELKELTFILYDRSLEEYNRKNQEA